MSQRGFVRLLGFPTLSVLLGAAIGYWYSQLDLNYDKMPLIRQARLRSAELAPWCVTFGSIIGLLVGLYCERMSSRGERRFAFMFLAVIIVFAAVVKLIHGDMF